MEIAFETQQSVVELIVFAHTRLSPLLVTRDKMALPYPYRIHLFHPSLVLAGEFSFSSPVRIFLSADFIPLLKERMTSSPSVNHPFWLLCSTSHRNFPGSSCFGLLIERTFWLIQHCCLMDHPDQVLEADAPTGCVFCPPAQTRTSRLLGQYYITKLHPHPLS